MPSPDCSIAAQQTGPAAALPALVGAFLRRIIRELQCGQLVLDTPCGRIAHDSGLPGPQARMTLHSWRALWRLFIEGNNGFARSYLKREWSSPDLAALLELACRNVAVSSRAPSLLPRIADRLRHALNRNTRHGSRRNIAAHYDLGNAFFAHWLDPSMTYSSAIYSSPDQSLAAAQQAKVDRVIDWLDPAPDHVVLEIGCGWGALAEGLIRQRGCNVTGLTLSKEQLDYASARLAAQGLAPRGDLRLQDYRELDGAFDRIVSIEMIEAVGEKYWPTFFDKIAGCLRRNGVAVLQAITIDERWFDDYRRKPDFIQQYIFPGGMLPTAAALREQVARAGLVLQAAETFGESYAFTLAAWRERFLQRWAEIEPLGFDQRFKRMWEYYLAYCEAGFRAGAIDVGLYRIVRPA